MRFFQIDHSFILIFNEIECFTFYKKLLSGKKTGRCPLSYTLLYYNELKRLLICDFSCNKKKCILSSLGQNARNTNKTNNFNKTIFSLKNRFIKMLHVVGNIT